MLLIFVLVYFNYPLTIILEHNNFFVNGQNLSNFEITENANQTFTSCYIQQDDRNMNWELVWEDQFEDVDKFQTQWNVEHETSVCKVGNCHRGENVRFEGVNGYLILMAKRETYLTANYTAASVNTLSFYTEGRYEIRASQPIGKQISACIGINNDQEQSNNMSQVIFVNCYLMDQKPTQGVMFFNKTVSHFYQNSNVKTSGSLHEFHIYGVEWNAREIVFFFDDFYSETIRFNDSDVLLPNQRIFLVLSIGLKSSTDPDSLPEDFVDLQWECPAFVIDYVRVFKNVSNVGPNMDKCASSEKLTEKFILKDVCNSTLAESILTNFPDKTVIPKKQSRLNTVLGVVILIVLLFIILLSTFLVIMFRSIKSRLEGEPQIVDENGHYDIPTYKDGSNYYEITHDYIDLHENPKFEDKGKDDSHIHNEYVQPIASSAKILDSNNYSYVNT